MDANHIHSLVMFVTAIVVPIRATTLERNCVVFEELSLFLITDLLSYTLVILQDAINVNYHNL